MSAKIEGRRILKEADLKESVTCKKLLAVMTDQSESELKWVQLHQMFDR